MPRSAGWTFAVLSSSRAVNRLAPCVTDAGHASRASRVKRAVGFERTPNQYGIQTPSPAFWQPPCRDPACALHILILSFGLYGHLPSHNNAYVFFDYTGIQQFAAATSAKFPAQRSRGRCQWQGATDTLPPIDALVRGPYQQACSACFAVRAAAAWSSRQKLGP